MADLDAEGDTLVAEFTLCHACCTSSLLVSLPEILPREKSLLIIADAWPECKHNFHCFSNNPMRLFLLPNRGKMSTIEIYLYNIRGPP
jgi:uncharacterized secreted protein with C-terminal beta-propeller domain